MDRGRHGRVLGKCVAVCWSVLQCVAVSVLQCVAACCSVLQRIAACCSVLQWVCCSVLQSLHRIGNLYTSVFIHMHIANHAGTQRSVSEG